jgi:hypothetical protein
MAVSDLPIALAEPEDASDFTAAYSTYTSLHPVLFNGRLCGRVLFQMAGLPRPMSSPAYRQHLIDAVQV